MTENSGVGVQLISAEEARGRFGTPLEWFRADLAKRIERVSLREKRLCYPLWDGEILLAGQCLEWLARKGYQVRLNKGTDPGYAELEVEWTE